MARVDTLPEIYRPMMGKPSVTRSCCAVCGRIRPLEQHHIVRRGAGKLFDGSGREIEKPTVTLCGFGNNLQDADGRNYCHGLAHANRLHFRWVADGAIACSGHWEVIVLDEPTSYLDALALEGWRRL